MMTIGHHYEKIVNAYLLTVVDFDINISALLQRLYL